MVFALHGSRRIAIGYAVIDKNLSSNSDRFTGLSAGLIIQSSRFNSHGFFFCHVTTGRIAYIGGEGGGGISAMGILKNVSLSEKQCLFSRYRNHSFVS